MEMNPRNYLWYFGTNLVTDSDKVPLKYSFFGNKQVKLTKILVAFMPIWALNTLEMCQIVHT